LEHSINRRVEMEKKEDALGINGLTWTKINQAIRILATVIMVIGAGFAVKAHIDNDEVHLSVAGKQTMRNIIAEGFTFSEEEKAEVLKRITLVEAKYENIDKQLDKIESKVDEIMRRIR